MSGSMPSDIRDFLSRVVKYDVFKLQQSLSDKLSVVELFCRLCLPASPLHVHTVIVIDSDSIGKSLAARQDAVQG